jgi:glycosyltransferase involved in cell wall biosynthesis
LKKILIISYFYPPANFVGAQRTAAWAKYLHEFGYYPIIITRQWNNGQTDLIDQQENNKLAIDYNKTHEVHRLPYKRILRDKLSNFPLLKPLQKALTLKELIFSNWSIDSLPFANFYTHSKQLLQDNPDIKIVIASGRPFQVFSIGYQLKKDFPLLHWIPDYRDPWSIRKSEKKERTLGKFIHGLDKTSEKKWTSKSTFFITVSATLLNSISSFINKTGIVITNGFDEEVSNNKPHNTQVKDTLEILYLGSIYSYQDFSLLFRSILEINKPSDSTNIHLTFLGSFANQVERKALQNKTEELGSNITLLDKVPHGLVQQYIQEADVLFLTEYINLEGCLPVKIFDYYNSSKPILLCPSDNDLMEKFIKETASGYIANSKEECKKVLQDLLQKKQAGTALIGPRNTKNAYFYKRKYQTQLLAEALDHLL